MAGRRPRNDIAQYDDLAGEWWSDRGAFAALHWLATARGALLPEPGEGAVLVDVACGGGLLAPWTAGYRHVGVDLTRSALVIAQRHGVTAVQGDAALLPLRDGCADVVVAGEVLEHVTDLPAVVAELARVLRPGGLLVVDTIADTAFARLALVRVAEHLPGGPPPRIHDPRLFVDPARLTALCAAEGIALQVRGLRPDPLHYLQWLLGRRADVRMVPVRSTAGVYQGVGTKADR
ncbi:MAG TPA: methyltransferase domain-containing protein [Mycobacteriales bacterium]|nr:methyltransferase domain-containing protein [Mycobacteriales bacterium]